MTSSSSILPENPIQTERFPDVIQDLILAYVADGIVESKSIYTAENRCTLFEGGAKKKPYDKLILHVALHDLLRHVVSGEQVEAQAIIKAHPEFLFESSSIKDLSGNKFFNFSSVELARFAHDVEMLKMMKLYADKVEGGAEKFVAILKNATEYEEAKKQEVYDFSRIITVFAGNNEEIVTDELNRFRQTFAPRAIENAEKSYNTKNLQKAYEVYVSHYYGWSADRGDLFWCQVIGFLQRSLPACFAQAFCQGLYNVTKCGKPLERGLKPLGGESFYPSDLSVSRGLGFDFGVSDWVRYRIRGEARSFGLVASACAGAVAAQERDAFGHLCQAKTTALRELMQQLSNRAGSRFCSIL